MVKDINTFYTKIQQPIDLSLDFIHKKDQLRLFPKPREIQFIKTELYPYGGHN